MKKAIIFDMDGVLIDSERVWEQKEPHYLEKLFGKAIAERLDETVGSSITGIYNQAKNLGATITKDEYQRKIDAIAFSVYDHATITPDLEKLSILLQEKGVFIGVVSSSPFHWINHVLPRVPFYHRIQHILSVDDHPYLRPKPYPDGYHEIMKLFHVQPSETVILEDSNTGIAAAKASGAFTIAFTQNLPYEYQQQDAHKKAQTIADVITLLKRI